MKLGWHIRTGKFHVAVTGNRDDWKGRKIAYITLCPVIGYNFLNAKDLKKDNTYMYPGGTYLELKNIKFSYDLLCKDCIKIFKKSNPSEKLKFELIKLKFKIK